MKHLARIQIEFVKFARDWDELSLEEQQGYLSRHPGSKRKLTGKSFGNDNNKSENNESKKKLRGNWGQKQTLKSNRIELFSKIKLLINDKYKNERLNHDVPNIIFNKIKIDVINEMKDHDEKLKETFTNMANDLQNKIDSELSELSENDVNLVNKYYQKSKELNLKTVDSIVSYMSTDMYNELNQKANDLLISLRQIISTNSNIDEDLNDYVNTKYKDVLDKDLELKSLVDELLTTDISTHGGERKDGTRIPGTSQYMEELSDDEIWKIFLSAEKYRDGRNTFKPHEMWALKYINENNPPLKMPFGKYKEKGWSAQDVIKKDKSYGNWLTDQIIKKDPDRRSPFEAWFIREYANEYLI